VFVQVIKGKVRDREAARRVMERWDAELRPGARGFLGATIGIADDGTLVNVARFDSREAAMANSERPEQGSWWAEYEKCFDATPTFRESEDVTIYENGDLDSAGFVQAMEGHLTDVERAKAMMRDAEAMLRSERPDLLGDVQIIYDDGSCTDLAYFESEAAARAGESKQPSAQAEQSMAEMSEIWIVDDYVDLRDLYLT
jgi:hypothetical protein